MTELHWYSARLRFVILVEEEGGDTLNDGIYILRASDFASAMQKALELGRKNEEEYKNVHGQRVIWRFMEILSLDVIDAQDLDGREVYSQSIHLTREQRIPFTATFHPEQSKPIQTI